MRFDIYAADRETGEEFVLALVADTEEEALAKANSAGYLVGDIAPAPAAPDTSAPFN